MKSLLRHIATSLRFALRHTWVGLLVLAAFALGWALHLGLAPADGSRTAAADHAGHGAESEPSDEAAPTVWTCAMHPQIRLPEAGLCPICAMDLVPLEANAGGGARRISIRPGVRELMGLRTSLVQRREARKDVRLVGKLAYDETRLARITAWADGRLERMFVDYTGVTVRAGDHLVELYSPRLYADQTALLQALERVRALDAGGRDALGGSARATLDAARERLRQLGLTEEQVAEVERRGSASDRLTVYTESAGVVVEKHAQQGDFVSVGDVMYSIADLSRLWVQLDAYESDLAWLRYGQEVEFTTVAFPGETFQGTITFLDPTLDATTRTVKVRVLVDNADRRLRPDMFVSATVHTVLGVDGLARGPSLAGLYVCPMHPEIVRDEPGDCGVCGMDVVPWESLDVGATPDGDGELPLVIPASAALITGRRAVVFVEIEGADEPTFDGREVVLGARAGDVYVVRRGLVEGERVVTNGNFKLDSALQIQAQPSMMTPEGGAAPSGHHGHGEETPATQDRTGGALDVPAGLQHELVAVDRAAAAALAACDATLEEARDAGAALEAAVDAIDGSQLSGDVGSALVELGTLLGNDGALLADARTSVDVARERAELERHLARLRAAFGTPPPQAERLDAPAELDALLATLWEEYLAVHELLATDRRLGAASVPSPTAALGRLAPEALDDDAVRARWASHGAALDAALAPLVAADSLEAERAAFEAYGAAMAALVNAFGLEGRAVLEHECPMAFGRGARWLQADDATRNPYYGSAMLECGYVVDELEAGAEASDDD